MAVDDRDYMHGRNPYHLSDEEKERRLAELRERFENAQEPGIVLKQKIRMNTGSYEIAMSTITALVTAVVILIGALAVIKIAAQSEGSKAALTQTARPMPPRPTNPAAVPIPPAPQKSEAERLAEAKSRAWLEYTNPGNNCQRPATALKELECKNRLDMQREAFELLWARKLASGWRP